SFSGGITHFSNGNFKMPNLGVNSVEFGVGLGFIPNKRPISEQVFRPDSLAKKERIDVRIASGTKVTGLVYSKRIFVVSLAGRYYPYSRDKYRLGGGLDLFYDPGYLYRDNPANVTEKQSLSNSFEGGGVLGAEILMGDLHFL